MSQVSYFDGVHLIKKEVDGKPSTFDNGLHYTKLNQQLKKKSLSLYTWSKRRQTKTAKVKTATP